MHTKRLLCLIARIQMKTYGEHIQDKRFLCLIARIQMKIYGEHIQDKRLQCLIARKRTQIYVKQIKKNLCAHLLIQIHNFAGEEWYCPAISVPDIASYLVDCIFSPAIFRKQLKDIMPLVWSIASDHLDLIVLKIFCNNIFNYSESHDWNHGNSASATKTPRSALWADRGAY